VFGTPGVALIAARGAAETAEPDVRTELLAAVESAGTRLALAQTALRRLWLDDEPGDPVVFDDVAHELLRCRDWLAGYVAEHLKA
jgi:hypothetical protein